jgi:uncharacterized protein YjiS (DUF1127 family)
LANWRRIALPFSDSRPPSLGLGRDLFSALLRALEAVLTWQERAAQRAALASLDERMLKDIGLSRAEAEMEAGRPFWRD